MPDGRTLEVHELGDPDGLAVIAHHGTPASGLPDERWATPGVRLLAYDRAGYGGSTRSPGRTVAAVATDIEAVADKLGLERFATWGISGGGPHALACAALCGDRLTATASLAGVAPWGADGLDWLAGMGEANVEEFDLVLAGEEALRPALERDRIQMIGSSPAAMREVFETLLGEADRAVLEGPLIEYMHENTIHGLETNADGWIDDNLAFVRPWGFDFAAIARRFEAETTPTAMAPADVETVVGDSDVLTRVQESLLSEIFAEHTSFRDSSDTSSMA